MKMNEFPDLGQAPINKVRHFVKKCCYICVKKSLANNYGTDGTAQLFANQDNLTSVLAELHQLLEFFQQKHTWLTHNVSLTTSLLPSDQKLWTIHITTSGNVRLRISCFHPRTGDWIVVK